MNIEEIVNSELRKVCDDIIVDGALKNIHFFYGDGKYEPGIYLYEEDGIYNYIEVGDRGGIAAKLKTESIEDVLYKLYSGITFNVAIKYAMVNKERNKDWRRVLFSKQLELLRGLGEIYYIRRCEEINIIIKESPYKDAYE